jgi:uncharacterized phiE125 gp8 family phage protein
MSFRLVTPPTVDDEPVSLAAMKDYLRVDTTDQDQEILGLIRAAREQAELHQGRELARKTLDAFFPGWPLGDFDLADPLVSVTSIYYRTADGEEVVVATDQYVVDTTSEPGRVRPARGATWPSAELGPGLPVRIRCIVGYEPDGVPAGIVAGIKMLVAQWYDNRDQAPQPGAGAIRLPFGIEALFDSGRLVRW